MALQKRARARDGRLGRQQVGFSAGAVWRRVLSGPASGLAAQKIRTVRCNRNGASVHGQSHTRTDAGMPMRQPPYRIRPMRATANCALQSCNSSEQQLNRCKTEFVPAPQTCQDLPTDLGHVFGIAMEPLSRTCGDNRYLQSTPGTRPTTDRRRWLRSRFPAVIRRAESDRRGTCRRQ